jgi:hypothetical protein
MALPPPANDDATIRQPPRRAGGATPAPAPAPGGTGRRGLLGLAGALAGGLGLLGVGAWLIFGESPPVPLRFGPRRLVPPLLRATVGGEDRIYLLSRRTEQHRDDSPGVPAAQERIELLAFGAQDLALRFAAHLATVPRGAMPDAGLIAEQGATLWAWLGGLGALSAVDGRVLADQAGLAQRNPQAPGLGTVARGQLRLADALVFDPGRTEPAWRIDPRDFAASLASGVAPRALPPLVAAAAHGTGGPTAFRVLEARFGAGWLGLPPEDAKLAAPVAARGPGVRFLSPAAPPPGTRQALWRGEVRLGSAAPPGWPANLPDRWGQAERLMDVMPVPAVAGLVLAGFLTAGTEAVLDPGAPAGALVLHGAEGQALGLLRLTAAGQALWRADLPIARLRSVLPGPGRLVLAGWAPASRDGAELMVSVALADGAVAVAGLPG